jgi:hypothetical protein
MPYIRNPRFWHEPFLSSAEGAAFNSHGRKAVDRPADEIKARRAGTFLVPGRKNGFVLRTTAAPSALAYSFVSEIHGLTAVAI